MWGLENERKLAVTEVATPKKAGNFEKGERQGDAALSHPSHNTASLSKQVAEQGRITIRPGDQGLQ